MASATAPLGGGPVPPVLQHQPPRPPPPHQAPPPPPTLCRKVQRAMDGGNLVFLWEGLWWREDEKGNITF